MQHKNLIGQLQTLTEMQEQATHLQILALLSRIGGQANPFDLLFLFGDDVHGHQHIECVIDTPSNVLLVIHVLKKRKKAFENIKATIERTLISLSSYTSSALTSKL